MCFQLRVVEVGGGFFIISISFDPPPPHGRETTLMNSRSGQGYSDWTSVNPALLHLSKYTKKKKSNKNWILKCKVRGKTGAKRRWSKKKEKKNRGAERKMEEASKVETEGSRGQGL